MEENKEKTQPKTAKTNDIVSAFRLINPAKLTKMETAERFSLILATRQLKKVATEFDDFLKDVQEKMKPEGFDAIAGKVQAHKDLAPDELKAWNKYQQDISECLKGELEKEVEVDFEPLSKEAMEHFIDSNDFAVSDIILIMDVLSE